MQDFLGFDLTSIDYQAWLVAARDFALPRLVQSVLQLLAAGAVFLVARWLLGILERRFASRTQTKIDDHIVEAIRSIVLLSIVFWALWRVAHIWDLPRAGTVISAVWIVALTLPIARAARHLLTIVEQNLVSKTESKLDDTALPWVNRVLSWGIVAIGVMVAVDTMGISIAPLLAGASVLGIGISFAAKDTLSNLIAGVLLIVDRPFEVGDRIEIWGAPKLHASWGDIVEIGLRATTIRTTDNIMVIIPNNEIMRRDIINYTSSGASIRLRIPIGIAYDANVDLAKKLCLQAADECTYVKNDPVPVCILRSFGSSSVDLQLRVWLLDARQRRDADDWLTERVKALFDEAGVEIPYPKRDLYIKQAPGGVPLWGPPNEESDDG
jgi:small-conductance mechanosensitive channel